MSPDKMATEFIKRNDKLLSKPLYESFYKVILNIKQKKSNKNQFLILIPYTWEDMA